MSCENCNNEQEGIPSERTNIVVRVTRETQPAYYRWKNANVEMNGCDIHLREIFQVLNNFQNNA